MATKTKLPIPAFFDQAKADQVYKVEYLKLQDLGIAWGKKYNLKAAITDKTKICLMPIDVQNSFCIPGFELYVGGRSGRGAVDDSVRMARFIYENLNLITEIAPTMDTHVPFQIFFPVFLINDKGELPPAMTMPSAEDIRKGVWKINPGVAAALGLDYGMLQRHLQHYVDSLKKDGKYALTSWTYHTMVTGIGHALVSLVEEAIYFHAFARMSSPSVEIKGGNPLTENFSVLRPEVLDTFGGQPIAQKNARFIKKLLEYDAVVIGGQAKSHCVASTIDDLLNEINQKDPALAKKVYLLEDCTSAVVVPGIIDFTDDADKAFARFAAAGMNIVKSTDPIETWPGLKL